MGKVRRRRGMPRRPRRVTAAYVNPHVLAGRMNRMHADLMFERARDKTGGVPAWVEEDTQWDDEYESAISCQRRILERRGAPIRDGDTFRRLTARQFYEEYCWVLFAGNFRVDILNRKFVDIRNAFHEFDPAWLGEMLPEGLSSRASNVFSIQSMQVVHGYLQGCRDIEKEGFEEFKHRLDMNGVNVLKKLPWIGDTRKYQLAREIGLSSAFARQLHNLPVRTSVRPAEHEVLEP